MPINFEYTDKSLMPFGKHAGEKLANIPAQYLIWLFESGTARGGIKKYIQSNLDVLRTELKLAGRNASR